MEAYRLLVFLWVFLVAIETAPTASEACYDVLGRDCFRYKDTDCVGPFETWARMNCSLRCGYCPQKLPCVDNLDYCNEFGMEVCHQEQYGQYMREHCRKFCNFCRVQFINDANDVLEDASGACIIKGKERKTVQSPTEYLVSSTLPTTTPEPTTTTTAFNSVSTWCRDNSTLNCWHYPDDKCVGVYEGWARVYCPYRCGYCPNLLPPCQDLDVNCKAYVDGSCTNTNYRAYMRDRCRKHCNECNYPGQYLMPNTPPSTQYFTVNNVAPNGVSKSTSTSPRVSKSTSTSPPVSTDHLVFITLTTLTTGLACPECDTNLNCVWNRTCSSGDVCMLLQYHNDPLTVHCSKKQDCIFMKTHMHDAVIKCCEDRQCVHNFIP